MSFNFFWQSITGSQMPWVPIVRSMVNELGANLKPGRMKFTIVLNADFADGHRMARGAVVRLSPDEYPQAYVFKFAERIRAGHEFQQIKRTNT